jgi:hypothetical protein
VFKRTKSTGVLTPLGGAQSSIVPEVGGGALDAAGKLYAVYTVTGVPAVRTFRVNKKTGVIQLANTDVIALDRPNQILFVKR